MLRTFFLFATIFVPVFVSLNTCVTVAFAQDIVKPAVTGDSSVARIGADIKYLASDELKGRQPGTPEMKLAEDYIVKAFHDAGLKPGGANDSFLQPFDAVNRRTSQTVNSETTHLHLIDLDGNDLELDYKRQFVPMVYQESYSLENLPFVFVGYGIDAEREHNFNDYRDLNVEGKVVILIRGEPQQNDADSVFNGKGTSPYSYLQTKIDAAVAAKAAAIIMVNDADRAAENDDADALANAAQFGRITNKIPFIHLKRETFEQVLKATPVFTATGDSLSTLAEIETQIDATLEPLSQTLPGWQINMAADFIEVKTSASNIIGIVEGQGDLAEETIVIGAHYDHLGMGNYGSRSRDAGKAIHNGADDNATGTAAVMELARRFGKRSEESARRIVFICFSAEEMGLLGAKHYVENPIVPLEQTVAMINFDMIGYLRENSLLMFGWDTSSVFDGLLSKANQDVGLTLVKPPAGFGGSDHLPFNAKNVPNVFFNTGLNAVYHTPDDDYEAINVEGAAKVIDFAEAFVDQLQKHQMRMTYDLVRKPNSKGLKLGVAVGVNDVTGKLEIGTVSKGSIAEKAGVKVGDQIMSFNGKTNVTSHRRLSREIKRGTGKKVQIILDRKGDVVILDLDLKSKKDK